MHIPIYLLKNGKSIVAKATVCLNVGPSLTLTKAHEDRYIKITT
jgi:ribosomal protein S27AE